jgi:transcriptional regulator with XRE-family HTH domain
MSQSQISKFETGKKTPSIVDLERILRALDVPADVVPEITSLARTARTEWEDKRSSRRRGILKRQTELATLEAEAAQLRYFLPAMITGLLATADYTRGALVHIPGDTAEVANRKLQRQAVLQDGSKHFTFLLTHQALTWPVVPAPAMAAQLERLADLSRLPNVRIGVIAPRAEISRGPMNTFTVYDDRLVTVENFTGRIVFRDHRDIAEHLAIFASFERHSLFGDDARQRLLEDAERYRRL